MRCPGVDALLGRVEVGMGLVAKVGRRWGELVHEGVESKGCTVGRGGGNLFLNAAVLYPAPGPSREKKGGCGPTSNRRGRLIMI